MTQFRYFWEQHRPLILILAVSWGLRAVLALRGGQLYWPDEDTYYFRTWDFVHGLAQADLTGPLDSLFARPVHPGFILVGILPATVHYTVTQLLRLPVENTMWIPALLLSLASAACIGLTYAIARKAGADKKEGLAAAFMMACAGTMFYYSRHLAPYDSSLALALLALWIGLDDRPGIWRSIICGIVASLALLTYSGYWLIASIAAIIHVLYGSKAPVAAGSGAPSGAGGRWSIFRAAGMEMFRRGIATGLGAIALPALLTAASIAWGAKPFVVSTARFASTVSQGDFAEGWSLTWEYLWHTEHGLLLVWVIGVGVAAWLSVKSCRTARSRILLWLGAAAGIYLLLTVFSSGLGMFVVYGRLARQLVPFLCLVTACGAACLADGWWLSGMPRLLGATVLVAQAAFNFAPPLMQRFPGDVWRQMAADYGHVTPEVTIQGPEVQSNDEIDLSSRYVLLNAQHLYPVRGPEAPPAGKTLFQTAHPLQFIPYQYEGFKPQERAILRSTDISMRLIETQFALTGPGSRRENLLETTPGVTLEGEWYVLELWDGVATRWMGKDAFVKVYPSQGPTSVRLTFKVLPFQKSRRLAVLANNQVVVGVMVYFEGQQQVESAPFPLNQGENTIHFHSLDSCAVPADLHLGTDGRCLAFAVQELRLIDLAGNAVKE
jgi:hypothetical protein